MNHAQLVGAQDGAVIVPTYDWAGYFDPFFKQNAFKGIKVMHHMRFSKQHFGKAFVKNSVDSQEREISLLRDSGWQPAIKELPPIVPVPPTGLSMETKSIFSKRYESFVREIAKTSFALKLSRTQPHQRLKEGSMAINLTYFIVCLAMHCV